MSTTDEWNEKLQCPKCGKTGMASLSQGDEADIPTVNSVPDGFEVVEDTSLWPQFPLHDVQRRGAAIGRLTLSFRMSL